MFCAIIITKHIEKLILIQEHFNLINYHKAHTLKENDKEVHK